MSKKTTKHYWDTCVFLAVLRNETHHGDGVLEGAVHLLKRAQVGQVTIITSEITITEILPSHVPADAYERFEAYLEWPNIIVRGVDRGVARQARDLRARGFLNQPQLKIKTPDAIQAATAMIYEADQINSMDERLNRVFGHLGINLIATKPYIPPLAQLPLELGILPPPSDTS